MSVVVNSILAGTPTGDITGVIAGIGLTGGGSTGIVTLDAIGGGSGFDPTLATSVFDDFTWGNQPNSPVGPFGFVPTGSAGGGVLTPANTPAPLTNRWGVIGLGLSTNSNSTADASFFSDTASCYAGQAQTTTLQFSVYTPAALASVTNDYVIDLGFRSDFGVHAQATNAMAISYDRALSPNWMGYTANNGTATNVMTANPIFAVTGAAWWNFKIVITASSVSFYAAPSGTAFSLIGSSSTNLPDSANSAFIVGMIYKTSSFALQRIFCIDWLELDMTFSAPR